MDKTSLGDRMKKYEAVTDIKLVPRVPVIIRIDGKCFHTVTRKLYGKEYNEEFVNLMLSSAHELMNEISGAKLAYVQSDEINVLITDYDTISTQGWFGYRLNKITSIAAACVSAHFTRLLEGRIHLNTLFDCRAFNLPHDEVCNYFIWRQQDATRNAIQSWGREYFSHRELNKKSCDEIQEMVYKKIEKNFNDLPTERKRGACVFKNKIDCEIPIFTQDRNYIEQHVYCRQD